MSKLNLSALRLGLIGAVAASSIACAGADETDLETSSKEQALSPMFSVTPVLFVPTDWSASSGEVLDEATHLQDAMDEIQEWYGSVLTPQFGGKTFLMEDLQVVQAFGPKENYGIHWNGRNIYEDGVEITGNVEHEVIAELNTRGFSTPPEQNVSGQVTLIFVKGAGGWAGGREFQAADGGWAIVGDWAIDGIQGQVAEGQYWWSGIQKQKGAVAHELGHTFDLPHPPEGQGAGDIMGSWWDYPNVGFNAAARSSLVQNKSPWFVTDLGSTNPGDGACAAICSNPVVVNQASFESGNLGTGASCYEIDASLIGMAWGNFNSPRQLYVNGVAKGTQGWTNTLPAPIDGGYCVQVPAGGPSWSWFATW